MLRLGFVEFDPVVGQIGRGAAHRFEDTGPVAAGRRRRPEVRTDEREGDILPSRETVEFDALHEVPDLGTRLTGRLLGGVAPLEHFRARDGLDAVGVGHTKTLVSISGSPPCVIGSRFPASAKPRWRCQRSERRATPKTAKFVEKSTFGCHFRLPGAILAGRPGRFGSLWQSTGKRGKYG